MNSLVQVLIFSFLVVGGLSEGKGGKCPQALSEMKNCCKFPPLEVPVPPECQKLAEEVKNSDGKERFKADVCLKDCTLKSYKIVNAVGDFDKDIVKTTSSDIFKQFPEFIQSAKDAADKCHELIQKKKAQHGNVTESDKKCGMTGFFVQMCMGNEMIKNCPEGKKITSEECKLSRAKVDEECKEM